LFSVVVRHAMAFSRAGRIAGGDDVTTGWKLGGPRLTQPSAYHKRQSASPSAEA